MTANAVEGFANALPYGADEDLIDAVFGRWSSEWSANGCLFQLDLPGRRLRDRDSAQGGIAAALGSKAGGRNVVDTPAGVPNLGLEANFNLWARLVTLHG